MVIFLAGLFIGTCLGVVVAALLRAAAGDDPVLRANSPERESCVPGVSHQLPVPFERVTAEKKIPAASRW